MFNWVINDIKYSVKTSTSHTIGRHSRGLIGYSGWMPRLFLWRSGISRGAALGRGQRLEVLLPLQPECSLGALSLVTAHTYSAHTCLNIISTLGNLYEIDSNMELVHIDIGSHRLRKWCMCSVFQKRGHGTETSLKTIVKNNNANMQLGFRCTSVWSRDSGCTTYNIKIAE